MHVKEVVHLRDLSVVLKSDGLGLFLVGLKGLCCNIEMQLSRILETFLSARSLDKLVKFMKF